MKKLSGETKLLLIMGLIVLLGGGFLALAPKNIEGPLSPNSTPAPVPPPPAPSRAEFDKMLGEPGVAVKGDAKANLAIIEFGDVECSSCRYAYDKFGKKFGKGIPVQLSFRHFPLEIHPFGKPCALALEAAGKQGKFWELYDALFTDLSAVLSEDFIKEKAKAAGLDAAKFEADRKSPDASRRVQDDFDLGDRLKVTHTPTFFVLNRKDGKIQVAVGPREFIQLFQGVPGIPTPEPEKPH